ncbi:MAG: HlyD family type I secretion periplasmic adaptor subunit [Lentilitoribacter sp.]
MTNSRLTKLRRSMGVNAAIGLLVTSLFLAAAVGWAATTTLSGAVISSGFLVVEGKAKKVQHPVGGIIADLYVQEGQKVRKGEVVARLDTKLIQADLDAVSSALNQLYARKARIEAELSHAKNILIGSELRRRLTGQELKKVMLAEFRLFKDRTAEREGEKNRLDEQIAQLHEKRDGLEQEILAKDEEYDLVREDADVQRTLLAQKLTQASQLRNIDRYAIQVKGQIGSLRTTIATTKGQIAEIKLQKLQIERMMRSENSVELRDLEEKKAELIKQEIRAKDALIRANIHAPISGIVHNLAIHTNGGVITPAEVLMEIVPQNSRLLIEAQIQPQDIDQLTIGASARLLFTAFNRSTTPEFKGTLYRISADLEQDEKTGMRFYRADVRLDEGEETKLKNLKLVPGMPADVFIKTQDRQALSWFVKPVLDHAAHTFKEE